MDQEEKDRLQKEEKDNILTGQPPGNPQQAENVHSIDATQAMFLPIGASFSLLVMFFFFDSMQMVFAVCTAVLATVAFAFLLLPMCQYLLRPCSSGTK
nr:signal peptide peptidase-like 3 [Lytechinus pictus]